MEQLTFKLTDFEGPLDLLEHLIKRNKLDICNISLIAITDQYIEYINAMQEMDLDISSDFLVVATELLYIKSKALLPKHEEEEDPEALANSLSLTMPYSLWEGLSDDLDKSCLTTHAWKEIEKRL